MIAQKVKACKVCGSGFTPARAMQVACSVRCASSVAQIRRAKMQARAERDAAREDRRRTKERKEALKTIPDLLKEAQTACNAYIRERDHGKPCISCGALPGSQEYGGAVDAGHYRSTGAAGHLRFRLDNIHGQCKRCNRYLSGNAVEMRRGMIERIGLKAVEALEADNSTRKWSRQELIDIKTLFKKRRKELKDERF